ncbi:MAG: DUF697 domain-containing protein [Pseudomonadota bacterium]|nr:DUF697 domain-containing protein [Pseudomonadota bacterium]
MSKVSEKTENSKDEENVEKTESTENAELAGKTVKNYMWFSMGAGLIPIPFLDLAAISGLQLKMIAELCKRYETPFKEENGKAVIAALLGFIVPESLSRGLMGSLLKAIPIVGPIAGGLSMPLFTGASTYAIGNLFIRHFESGGTLLNMDPQKMRDHFKEEFENGKKVAEEVGAKLKS